MEINRDVNLKKLTPEIRYLYNMKDVIYDQRWLAGAENSELYYMYRGIKRKEGLRYDITIVPARMLGNEFVKTKGHYHIGEYKEIYIVLEGQAIYLMQKKKNGTEDEIEDVYAVEAKKGNVVLIPSFYGHITINPSKTQGLKMANWISDNCRSDYSPFEKTQGACYYYTEQSWIKNRKYKRVPELRFEKLLKSAPENLEFLK